MVKVTLADVEQMSDSQRIIFKAGVAFEHERIVKLLQNHEWFEQGEKDDVLAILDGSYKCECDGCITFKRKGK
jgi:hypothetical protein